MMDLDEAIQHCTEVAEENQRVVDTGVVFDDVTIDMLYCDDTEVIEEHLANYQKCASDHRQLAEWLKELKDYRKTWYKIKFQIKEESNFAYADFDKYKYEVLGVDDIDELPDDDFRYGMQRALEIINEYIREVKENG